MAFAQGSRTSLRYATQASFGGTPATTLIELPYSSHTLDLTKERVTGSDILGDRIPRVDRHGNKTVSGDIVCDFRANEYDAFLESAMFNTFTVGDELTVGTSPQYLDIEDAALDVSEYRIFASCAVNQMSMSIAPNQMVQTTFSLIGQDMVQSSVSGATTAVTDSTGETPMDSFSAVFESPNGSVEDILTSFDFSVNNNLNPTFVVGSATAPQFEFGQANIEGNLTLYYEDETFISSFLNENETSLEIALSDGTDTYTFLFPVIKFNGASVPVQNEQSRIITLPFVALYDSSTGTNLKITKS